ncbi:nose resistant to fluoxetine 6-like [Paramuricea clavata]|uniref:Nose resistant to fluoxetine 6-like n=2 Tax=Paramuricea clavata TaxID=317549 RepID=A0A7D9KYM4_PARCT|nr:nose resistant to fluoxetine 6-like [Paramuricea clavata]
MDYPTYNISIEKIIWGACFPKSCSVKDIYIVMQLYILPTVKKETGIDIKYPGSLCPEGPTYSTGVKVTIAFFGVLLLFCVIGTLIDMVIEERKQMKAAQELPHGPHTNGGKTEQPGHTSGDDYAQKQHSVDNFALNSDNRPLLDPPTPIFSSRFIHNAIFSILGIFRDFLLCFSLVRNSRRIFNTNVPATAITCINGIRVISISWVILGHMFLLFIYSPFTDNKTGLLEDSQLFSIMPVINGYYSVDSFFFLSGLLVAYTCFRKLEKSGGICKFNWFLFYFHRFWRLTPTYMAVILISVQLKRFLADGPLWYSQYEDKLCEEHWWTNLLYINNFYPKEIGEECLGVSWYLANDMQFFVITPPLLILMYKFRWRGIIGPGSLIAASTAAIAFIIGYWDLDPLSSLKIGQQQTPEQQKKSDELGKYVYTKPWCRAQPYLVGFILGYYIYRSSEQYYNRRRRLAVFWLVTVIGWAVAAALGMWLVYGPHKYIEKGADEWPLAGRVAYGMFERLLWGLVLAWVTYACHFGGGGLVQKFLSAKFWIPLSRLTFNVYLIHIIVIMVMMFGAQGNIHYDFFNIAYYYISAIVLSYVAAYILAVTVEFPLDNLENMVLKLIKGTRR